MTEYTDDTHVMLTTLTHDGTNSTDATHNTVTHADAKDGNTNSTDTTHNTDDVLVIDDVNHSINHKDNELNDEEDNNKTSNEEVKEDNFMLTTVDNPHNPKEDYDLWKQWDAENGYYTEEYIARLVTMDDDYNADDDDEFMLNIISTRVINDILSNDNDEVYVLL